MKTSEAWKILCENASLNSILGGGMSVPIIHLNKEKEHIEVKIHIPGVDSDDLFVEIQGEKVVVYRMVEVIKPAEGISEERLIVHWFPITSDIEFKNIHAFHEDGLLKIILPLGELKA